MKCCHNIYHTKFDSAKAAADLSNYLENGVKRNSRPLLRMIKDLDLQSGHVLDIGSGVGSLTFELLKGGAGSASLVDISPAYLDAFQKEASRRQLNNISTYVGDCVELSDQLPKAELIVMDKVICCYPEWQPLVRAVSDLSLQWIAFSVPKDVWWVKAGEWVDNTYRQLRGDCFPTYIHPTGEIHALLSGLGFERQIVKAWREWEYALFEKREYL